MWGFNDVANVLYKHIIVGMFCLKLTSHRIPHLRFHLRHNIAMRNPFLQSKSYSIYIYISLIKIMLKI